LVAALKDPDPDLRERAAEVLGKIGDSRAVEPLVLALGDPFSSVRERAADALGKIGTRAVEPLIAALKDADSNFRERAAGALGKIGTPAVGGLIAALKDPESDVRGRAAKVLGKIGDSRAVEPLIAALGDPDTYVRFCASEALGKIGDPRAVAALAERKAELQKAQARRAPAAEITLDDLINGSHTGSMYDSSSGLVTATIVELTSAGADYLIVHYSLEVLGPEFGVFRGPISCVEGANVSIDKFTQSMIGRRITVFYVQRVMGGDKKVVKVSDETTLPMTEMASGDSRSSRQQGDRLISFCR
jgi:hypothetical protein